MTISLEKRETSASETALSVLHATNAVIVMFCVQAEGTRCWMNASDTDNRGSNMSHDNTSSPVLFYFMAVCLTFDIALFEIDARQKVQLFAMTSFLHP